MKHSREYAAVSLWVAALSLNTYSAAEYAHRRPDAMLALGWGLFLGQVAMILTGWCIAEQAVARSQLDVERIAEVVDALHDARSDVRRLNGQ